MYYNINRAQTQVFFNNYLVDLFLRDSSIILLGSSIYFYAIHRFIFTRFVDLFIRDSSIFLRDKSADLRKPAAHLTKVFRSDYENPPRRTILKNAAISRSAASFVYRFICPLSWRASRSESQAPRRLRPRTPLSTFRKPREVRKRKERARRI